MCSICLEGFVINPEKRFELECKHLFHRDCLESITSDKCPLCRHVITHPEDLVSKIRENSRLRKEEIVQEEQFEISNELSRRNEFLSKMCGAGITGAIIEQEVFVALEYLTSILRIPMLFIPTEILVVIDVNSPSPDRYVVFNTIVTSIISFLGKYIRMKESSDDESSDESQDSSSDDEENQDLFHDDYYKNLQRNYEVIYVER